jgi:hypothetical protein
MIGSTEEVEDYVNKLFMKLGFGELGVNAFEDKYYFEVGDAHFTYEPVGIVGGGDGIFPDYKGLGAVVVSIVVRSYDSLKSIPGNELLSWLTTPPMFGSVFLEADEEGKPQLSLKQETVLSGNVKDDLSALIFVLDNLYGQYQDRS